jgi:hypothetical protein
MNFYQYFFATPKQDIKRDQTPLLDKYTNHIRNDEEFTEKDYELFVREIDIRAEKLRPYFETRYKRNYLMVIIPNPKGMDYHLRYNYSRYKCKELLKKIQAYSDYPKRYACGWGFRDDDKGYNLSGIHYDIGVKHNT